MHVPETACGGSSDGAASLLVPRLSSFGALPDTSCKAAQPEPLGHKQDLLMPDHSAMEENEPSSGFEFHCQRWCTSNRQMRIAPAKPLHLFRASHAPAVQEMQSSS